MPPPGGYPAAPWRRNLPGRGFGYIGVVLTCAGYGYFWWSRAHHRYGQWRRELKLESENMDMACMPLYEAETDRDELRALKHQIECKSFNFIFVYFLLYLTLGGQKTSKFRLFSSDFSGKSEFNQKLFYPTSETIQI